MNRVYITQGGEMLDEIAYKVYGDETLVQALYEANPGMVDQPIILPHGIEIILPEMPQTPAPTPINDVWG